MTTHPFTTLEEWLPDMARIRRDIHAWPELSFQETRTANTMTAPPLTSCP